MEGDEMEMSKEELRRWIRESVTQGELISTDVLQKCHLLQSLLERRHKQAARLLKLCECVAACEAIVRKQYSLLGWEYRDTDSGDDDDDNDDDDETGSGYSPPSPCEFGHAEAQAPTSQSTSASTHLLPKPEENELYNSFIKLKKKPVVVLRRLPACVVSSLHPPAPWNHYSEDETLNKLDSDMAYESERDSRESNFSISAYNTGPNKRRKTCRKAEDLAKRPAARSASTRTSAKSSATKTSTPQANRNTNSKSSALKTSTTPANTNGVTPSCSASSLRQSSDKVAKTPRSVPQREISVNMKVLAMRRAMSWQQGKIISIIKKEDGGLKYKVSIEGKGKILVSGHHLAFDCMADVEEVFVGARVVMRYQAEKPQFSSGVVAELPSRQNHMRFLVFTDDHKPFYIGLPLFHLVCRPLEDPLDDISDDTHKNFMKKYIKSWPNLPQTQYKVGQIINAELNGAQQRCKVVEVDSSLIQVVFEKHEQKEWIYRGSFRLENNVNATKHFGLNIEKRKSERTKSTADQGSSKSQ